jgi:hypothetical protein
MFDNVGVLGLSVDQWLCQAQDKLFNSVNVVFSDSFLTLCFNHKSPFMLSSNYPDLICTAKYHERFGITDSVRTLIIGGQVHILSLAKFSIFYIFWGLFWLIVT